MLTLILGGARSGKSQLAQRLATRSGRPVLFVATLEPLDEEVAARIESHRASRPDTWRVIEAPRDAPDALARHARPGDFVLFDCMTVWIANEILARIGDADAVPLATIVAASHEILAQVDRLLDWCGRFDGEVAIVSNEVGMSVVPPYRLGRVFRDVAGEANKRVAARADRAYLAVAGLALELKSLGALPVEDAR